MSSSTTRSLQCFPSFLMLTRTKFKTEVGVLTVSHPATFAQSVGNSIACWYKLALGSSHVGYQLLFVGNSGKISGMSANFCCYTPPPPTQMPFCMPLFMPIEVITFRTNVKTGHQAVCTSVYINLFMTITRTDKIIRTDRNHKN